MTSKLRKWTEDAELERGATWAAPFLPVQFIDFFVIGISIT